MRMLFQSCYRLLSVFHDLRDKDTAPGQNLPSTSAGSAPVQASRLKLSGYLQKIYFEKSKKSFNALAVVVAKIFAKNLRDG